jgi:hypothetical protein
MGQIAQLSMQKVKAKEKENTNPKQSKGRRLICRPVAWPRHPMANRCALLSTRERVASVELAQGAREDTIYVTSEDATSPSHSMNAAMAQSDS